MREKSKFISFILSFIPGLSHLYLGFADRAVIFLMVFFGTIAITAGLVFISHSDVFLIILILALPIIWLVALLDAFSLARKMRLYVHSNDENTMAFNGRDEVKESNRKIIALALSTIPGAGHMYLGLQNKGLILMAVFFFTVFFMGWLSSSLFLFILPLIWFYGFFDAFHIVNGTKGEEDEFMDLFLKLKPEWIGWAMIAIGILVVVERIVFPLIPYQFRDYIQTSIVSLIFIFGGIKLLIKSKTNDNGEGGKEPWQKDE